MDNDLMRSLVGLGGIPFILGLTQLIKPWVKDTRWYAPISVLWGLAINLGLAYALGSVDPDASGVKAIFLGIMAGLAAGGLYSAGATVREGAMAVKDRREDVPPSPGSPRRSLRFAATGQRPSPGEGR